MSIESFKGSRNHFRGFGSKNTAAFFPFLIVVLWLTNYNPPAINAQPVDRDSLEQVKKVRRIIEGGTEENSKRSFGKDHSTSSVNAILYKLKGDLKYVYHTY